MLKLIKWGFIILIGLFAVIQLIPYGHDKTNPPVIREPSWDSPATRDLAVRACFDCHSNETNWPWYSYVAPMSWVIQSHVEEGRDELNFSEWGQSIGETDDIAESIIEGEMPLWAHLIFHPEARLSASERNALILGLGKTIGN